MTFSPIKPGGWALGERLFSAAMNALNSLLPNAVDGGAGGEYEPSSPLEIRGTSALKVDTPVDVDDASTKRYVDQLLTAAAVFYLDDNATAAGGTFDVEPAPMQSYVRVGTWTIFDNEAIEVPESGLYRVDFLAEIDGTSLGGEVEVDLVCGATVIGWARGVPASPNKVIGWASVEITVPATQRLSFKPGNGVGQTPETESDVSKKHQIFIQRIGGLG